MGCVICQADKGGHIHIDVINC